MIYTVTAVIVLIASLMTVYRVIKGPTLHDRLLAANVIGTNTIILLALIGFIFERPHFLDIAIVYALINFIAMIAVLKFMVPDDMTDEDGINALRDGGQK